MKSPTEIISPQEIVLRNDESDVVHLNEFVTQVCDAIHCDTAAQFSIQLALEEAVVNAMNYAYAAGTEGEIRVKAEGNTSAITFEIRDRGIPFDPTLADDPDISLPAEKDGFKVPRIHPRLCNGCGVCEFYCPARPKAINVEGR